MPCHGLKRTLDTIRRTFDYVFVPTQVGGGKPALDLIAVDGSFVAAGVNVTPIPIFHGAIPILGYRIGDLAYVTDCSDMPDSSVRLLEGLDTLVLGVLRPEPHETHFSVSEGLAVVEMLKPRRAYFTHISHRLDHDRADAAFPPNVQLAYDGLKVDVPQVGC